MRITKVVAFLTLVCFSVVVRADDVRIYFNHDVDPPAIKANLESKIISLIDSANSTLDIAVYDLDLSSLAHAIAAAKDRGVDVRLVTDEDNIGGESAEAYAILDEASVPWIDDTADGSAGSGLQHNKLIVVDGATVLTGSSNFTQSGLLGDLDSSGNITNEGNDNHIVIIDSVQLASVVTNQLNYMWGDGPGGAEDSLFGLGKPDHTVETLYTTNDNVRIDVQFSPQSPTVIQNSTLETLGNYLSSAQTRIYVAQFVISSQDLADAMQARHNAGVVVKGIGDSSFFYRYFSEFLDMMGEAELNNDGEYETDSYTGAPNNPWSNTADVRVASMAGGDKWHHKYFLVDDMVITGSHNASGAGSFSNDENIMIIHDSETAGEFAGHFDRAYCEAGSSGDCGGPTYEGGTWEGVTFTAEEVGVVLDIANNASMYQLDIEAAMNKRAAENIIAARPIMDMDQLADVPYVGPAAMQDLKDYIIYW